jgi:tetratricopeptide (TPR) repeat protein
MGFVSVRHSLLCVTGGLLLKTRRWSLALSVLDRAVELDPDHVLSQNARAVALLKLGRWEDAAAAFRCVVGLNPSAAEPLENLVAALLHLSRWDEAVVVCQRELERDPNRASLYERLGIALTKLERWDAAADALHRVLALDPASIEAKSLLRQLGAHGKALDARRRAAATENGERSSPAEPPVARLDERRASFWRRDHLPPEVFQVERWLGRLATPAHSPSSGSFSAPRLLFILDDDYGELTTLMYLVLGQPLLAQTMVLVPDRLFEKNADALPGRIHRYVSVEDILQLVDRHRPEVVFLCSGYLLPIHRLLALEELEHLVTSLRERGCRIVTADPFLGVLSQQDARDLITIDVPKRVEDELFRRRLEQAKKREEERLWTDLSACERLFKDTYHLYPANCDLPPHQPTVRDARNISFFNAQLVYPEPLFRERGGRPHWLFILSRTDYEAQVLFETPLVFIDLVAEKLAQTLAAGRHPILIGPNDMIDALGHRFSTADGVDTLAYCSFSQFMSLVLSAEHAFYWNVLSHSLLIRLFNKLPTIIFDRGHLVRNVPAMYERVVQWYYQGWQPTLVDHNQALTLDTVSAWAAPYLRNADRIREGFQRARSPVAMIEDVLSGEPAPAVENRSGAR